jgi:hypothetical protein
MNCKHLFWSLNLLAALVVTQVAQASSITSETVLYSSSELVLGSDTLAATLAIPSAGDLFLTLTDYQFPAGFASLDLQITDASTTVLPLSAAGSYMLSVSGPETLYADVFATAQSSGSDMGLYNLTATFVPALTQVPLPASGLLLVALGLAFGGLKLTMRRQPRATVTTAVA